MDVAWKSLAPTLLERLHRIREELHQHPELAFREHGTATLIAGFLRSLGCCDLQAGVAGTGLIARLRGGPGRTVAFRAELDGLPIEERTGLAYASRNAGQMHACGHDGHMAVLLGVAALYAERGPDLPGGAVFVFQPAEEDGAGAQAMVAAGALGGIDAMLGIHARPGVAPGQIELAEVPSAAADAFDLHFKGRRCHGAYPEQGRDALLAAAHVVTALQQIVSRRLPAIEAAVVSVGVFRAGEARNVVAGEALLQGTIRTRAPDVRRRALDELERVARETASALGVEARLELLEPYPRVHNDPVLLRLVEGIGRAVLGPSGVRFAEHETMGADDFGFYLTEQGGVPGCMIRLGVESQASLHTDGFDFGRAGLEPGVLVLANAGLAMMQSEGIA